MGQHQNAGGRLWLGPRREKSPQTAFWGARKLWKLELIPKSFPLGVPWAASLLTQSQFRMLERSEKLRAESYAPVVYRTATYINTKHIRNNTSEYIKGACNWYLLLHTILRPKPGSGRRPTPTRCQIMIIHAFINHRRVTNRPCPSRPEPTSNSLDYVNTLYPKPMHVNDNVSRRHSR